MRLSEAVLSHTYTVTSVEVVNEIYNSRVVQLGIIPGVEVQLVKKAPIFKDPLLFNLGESQIALTTEEASHILIEEVES